jgi:hypothetical protein
MKQTKFKKLTRSLLASTALTIGAEAAIVTEGPDFSNNFPSPTLLASGTTGVAGTVTPVTDYSDVVQFGDLAANTVLNYTASFNSSAVYIDLYNSGGQYIGTANNGTGSLTVPGDGILRLNIGQESSSEEAYSFQFGTAVPEPGTLTGVGLGLAALAAARRKK